MNENNFAYYQVQIKDPYKDTYPQFIRINHPLDPNWSVNTLNIHCPIEYLDLKKITDNIIDESHSILLFGEERENKSILRIKNEFEYSIENSKDDSNENLKSQSLNDDPSSIEYLDKLQNSNNNSKKLLHISKAKDVVDFEYIFPIRIDPESNVPFNGFIISRASTKLSDILKTIKDLLEIEDSSLFVYKAWKDIPYQLLDNKLVEKNINEIFSMIHNQMLIISVKENYISNKSFKSNENLISSEFGPRFSPGLVGFKAPLLNCYMNSALQALTKTKPLVNYFLNHEYHKSLNLASEKNGKVAMLFAELIQNVWKGDYNIIDIENFKKLSGECFGQHFSNIQQQDAAEILRYIIDSLSSDLSKNNEISNNNLISTDSEIYNIFGGEFRDEINCSNCGNITYSTTSTTTVNIPIPGDDDRFINIVFVSNLNLQDPKIHKVARSEFKYIRNVKNFIIKTYNLIEDFLMVVSISNNYIEKKLNDEDKIDSIKTIYIYQMVEFKPELDSYLQIDITSFIQWCMKKKDPKIYLSETKDILKIYKFPILIYYKDSMTQEDLYKCLLNYFSRHLTRNSNIFNNPELYFPYNSRTTKIPSLIDDNGKIINYEPEFLLKLYNIDDKSSELDYDNTTSNIFKGGKYTLDLTGKNLDKLINWMTISIEVKIQSNIPISLYDCLNLFQSGSEVSDFVCDSCKKQTKAVIKTHIYKSPKILIICLKRFTNQLKKIDNFVEIPFEISLDEYIPNDCKNRNYELFALINHHGQLDFGHYICHAKVNDKWMCFDDQNVYEILLDVVKQNMKNSYVLLYCAKD